MVGALSGVFSVSVISEFELKSYHSR